jgi:hypothetical protein
VTDRRTERGAVLARSSTMPAPFLSYLRVYEPLRAFAGPSAAAVRAGLARGAVPAERAGTHERAVCLRAQLGSHLLPGDGSAGGPVTDVLVLGGETGEPMVCPLDTRPRAAAAVLGFLAGESPLLGAAALPVPAPVARRTARAAVNELGDGAAHVVSASWTVPLPWFALVDSEERQLRLDRPRRVWWRVPIGRARSRAARAERIVREGLGDTGPAEVLAETGEWLQRFDRGSLVELDYGGVAELFDDDALRADTSAGQVREALAALRDGEVDRARERYEQLREFWGAVVRKQRSG